MYYSFFLENSTISLFIVIKWVRDAECRESLKRGKEKKKTTVNDQNNQRQKYLIPALGCIKTNFINMSKWTTVSEEFFLGQERGCTLRY